MILTNKAAVSVPAAAELQRGRPSAARLILRNCADVYPGGTDPVQFSQSALHIWEEALLGWQ